MATWKLFFDGACPNGVPHFGWTLTREGMEADKGHGPVDLLGPDKTTNVAEYGGLIHGLAGTMTWLRQHDTLGVYGDSQLVVRQVTGMYRVKKEHLIPYVKKAHEFIKAIQAKGVTIAVDWVPREQNKRADELSKTQGASPAKAKSDWKEIQEDVPPSLGRV